MERAVNDDPCPAPLRVVSLTDDKAWCAAHLSPTMAQCWLSAQQPRRSWRTQPSPEEATSDRLIRDNRRVSNKQLAA